MRTIRFGLAFSLFSWCATAATFSSVDGALPVALQPGSPAGSYALSDFESINLYSGHLSLALPLLTIGGRGETGYTLTLQISRPPWILTNSATPSATQVHYGTSPVIPWWHQHPAGYTPGRILQKFAGELLVTCNSASFFTQTWSYVAFVSPDGSETPLCSAATPDPIAHTCLTPQPVGRGRTFVARDGSGLTFVSTVPLTDIAPSQTESQNPAFVSGTLFMKNGVRYVFDQGNVTEIRDRHGNRVTIGPVVTSFPPGGGTLVKQVITDSLGRDINITYGNPDTGVCDKVEYSGYGGNRWQYAHHPGLSGSARRILPPEHLRLGTRLGPKSAQCR